MTTVFFISPDERKNLANAGDRPPLGALTIATYLSQEGIDVKVFDLNYDRDYNTLMKSLFDCSPDFVCFSFTSSPVYSDLIMLLRNIKENYPGIKTIVGGYHVTVRPDDFKEADFVVRGDGAEAILKIIKGQKITDEINFWDVNKIAFPDRNFLDPFRYNMKQDEKRAATLMTSIGCPFDCVFCGNFQRKLRFRKPEFIDAEIKHLKFLGYEALYLLDDCFVANREHFLKVTEIIKDNGLPYRCTTRSSLINDEVAKRLSETGCKIVSIGIESANNKTLELVSKRTTVEQHERAIKSLNKFGIDVKGFFIVGLPGESFDDVLNTIDWACRMKKFGLKTADWYALTPFPGSKLYDDPKSFGINILSTDWDDYLQAGKELVDPIIETDKLSKDMIKELLDVANKSFKLGSLTYLRMVKA